MTLCCISKDYQVQLCKDRSNEGYDFFLFLFLFLCGFVECRVGVVSLALCLFACYNITSLLTAF